MLGDEDEVIVLPDGEDRFYSGPALKKQHGASCDVSIVPTGSLTPARKRDIGIQHARGDILAFLDDDAYPSPGWLPAALQRFRDASVGAVAGPAVTPPSDTLRQQASGLIYSSVLVSGPYVYRYVPRQARFVDDYPSCNLLVRREVLVAAGGFDTEFWPGEDTRLCLVITQELKKKIAYDPQVLVYHHRRSIFAGHLQQVASYALHRGYFVKRGQSTSIRPGYFLPSILTATLASGGAVALILPTFGPFYAFGVAVYAILAVAGALVAARCCALPLKQRLAAAALVAGGIIATHLTYGTYFLEGLTSRTLREER